ncbi:MAG: hypothetical protein IJ395_01065 [Clostridia bacterium]|nr:hypothetical protein [Clostridia bacterium]
MDLLKISFVGILTALLYGLIRQVKPEMAPLVILGGTAVIILAVSDVLLDVTDSVNSMMELAGLEKENVSLLIKSLGICVVTQFAADICYDNSSSTLGSAVELAGRLGAIALALPMIKSVARIAVGLING